MHTAIHTAGQVPDDPGVYVAEDSLTSFGRGACALDVVENPLNLAGGKIGCWRQPGFASNRLACARLFQPIHDPVRARVLPDDGVVERFARLRIPDDSSLPLVSYADCGK